MLLRSNFRREQQECRLDEQSLRFLVADNATIGFRLFSNTGSVNLDPVAVIIIPSSCSNPPVFFHSEQRSLLLPLELGLRERFAAGQDTRSVRS